jgi:hypothetical protein
MGKSPLDVIFGWARGRKASVFYDFFCISLAPRAGSTLVVVKAATALN